MRDRERTGRQASPSAAIIDSQIVKTTESGDKSEDASVIKTRDKTSNLRALAKSPPPWPLERKRTYLAWARSFVAGLPYKPPGLLAEFEKAAAELEALRR